ncbi:MAG: hypothetical protein H6742_03825 [Alphaproteobacteria bacterium]|nr:hypothetical protein [Alphaproteobacteria bacterium]
MTRPSPWLRVASLGALALAGCHSYEGDFGACDVGAVRRMDRAEIEVYSTHWGGVVDQWSWDRDYSGFPVGDDVLVCVSGMADEESCMADTVDDSLHGISDRIAEEIPDASDWYARATDEYRWVSERDCGPMWLDEMCCWTYRYEKQTDTVHDSR